MLSSCRRTALLLSSPQTRLGLSPDLSRLFASLPPPFPRPSHRLWQLNQDGTQKLDGHGEPLPTYDNTHIVSFAKAWTGFALQPWRSNLESPGGPTSSNFIDPMRILAKPSEDGADSTGSSRDLFPKWNLYDGHLG